LAASQQNELHASVPNVRWEGSIKLLTQIIWFHRQSKLESQVKKLQVPNLPSLKVAFISELPGRNYCISQHTDMHGLTTGICSE
jgi:hypothetical protein